MSIQPHVPTLTDSEPTSPASSALVPTQITFRHLPTSPAVAALVAAEAVKLSRLFDRITHCHVVIDALPPHHRPGRRFSLRIDLGVPHGPLVINHEPSLRSAPEQERRAADASHEDIYVVVRDSFDAARRRLEDHARRLRGEATLQRDKI